MIRVVIYTLIELILFSFSIRIINKNDRDKIVNFNVNWKIGIIFLLSTTLIYIKFENNTYLHMFLIYLIYYLVLTAYTDYKTKYIYSIFNYLTMLVGTLFIYYIYKDLSIFVYLTIIIISYSLVITFLNKIFKFFGNGDNEMYIALAFFICSIWSNFPMEMLLINMILSNFVAIIINISKLNFWKMKFKEEIAFAPSIAISLIVLLLVI